MNALDAKDIVMNKRFTGCTDKISRATLRLMEDIVQAIELILSGHGVKLEREYRFNSATRHRFDFAIPAHKIALEYEGAIYAGGRHVRGKGYSNDCIKYNIAACLGWTVLRYTSDMLRDNPGRVLDDVLMLIKNKG